MADQEDIVAGRGDLGGTMRLGAYPATLTPGSIVAEAYGSTEISERHRHRYEVNNAYRDQLTRAGLHISGTSPDGRLVEFVELDRGLHPFFVATQAHPELKSRPTRPHPLFAGFVKAAVAYSQADQLPVDLDPVVETPRTGTTPAETTPAGTSPAEASKNEAPTAKAAARNGAATKASSAS